MRKVLSIMLLLMLVAVACAQDVTRFLGVPVDGTKAEMIQKLKAKGYTYDSTCDCLNGEFNGRNVNIFIAENKGKVWRIGVCDNSKEDKESIKIYFNDLCSQFDVNTKYVSFGDYKLSKEEDVAYEISMNSKKYDAIYYQVSDEELDSVEREVKDLMQAKYTAEQLDAPTDEMRKYKESLRDSYLRFAVCFKPVWFRIFESRSMYYIVIFYDNEYNKANGEDL